MGLKKIKIRPKDIQILPVSEKGVRPPKESRINKQETSPALRIVRSEDSANVSANSLEAKNNSLENHRVLNFYHLMSDLVHDTNLNLSQLMETILQKTVELANAKGGGLWMVEENRKEVTCKVATGIGKNSTLQKSIPMGKGLVGWVSENGKSSLVLDANIDDRINELYDFTKEIGVTSALVVPLNYRGEVLGAISIMNKQNGEQFQRSEQLMLEDICTQAAMHIKAGRLLKSNEDLHFRIQTFADLHEEFSSTMELGKLLGIVLEKAIKILKAEVASIWLVEEKGEGIECFIAEGPTKDKVIGVKVKKGIGIVGWVVDKKEPIIVEDCSKDSRFSQAMDKKIGFETKSMITVPLVVKGECIGAIQIINKKGKFSFFDREDLGTAVLFGANSAMYIKNARLFESEKKAKELQALIQISKEITSTLDIDSVLMSIVNLSSQIIPYDSAAISTEKRGEEGVYQLRSISGEERVNRDNAGHISYETIHNILAKKDGEFYVADFDAYKNTGTGLPEIISYMEQKGLKSFWKVGLKDDQGTLGIITLESNSPDIISPSRHELLTLLITQATVALRNASLYTTIPSGNPIGGLKDKFFQTMTNLDKVPKKVIAKWASLAVAIVATLVFVPFPHHIGSNIEIVPVTRTYYSMGQGPIQRVLVKEGEAVKKGQLLAEIDVSSLQIEKAQKMSQRQKVINEYFKLKVEDKIAEYKIKEQERFSLDYEIKLLDQKISNAKIVADTDGVIVSQKIDEMIGKPVNFGEEIIKVASHDELYVKFEIPEADVADVRPGQDVDFKVYSYPTDEFDSIKLISLSGEGLPLKEGDKDKFFYGHARINARPDGSLAVLRAGMTGRGNIQADWRPIGQVLFGKILSFLMLKVFF